MMPPCACLKSDRLEKRQTTSQILPWYSIAKLLRMCFGIILAPPGQMAVISIAFLFKAAHLELQLLLTRLAWL
jgi:hypothetical protein